MAEAHSPAIIPAFTQAFTDDAFFGGRLVLRQPARGHRSGTDAVLLAAAVPRDVAGLVADVGSGVGAAGLGIALACPSVRVRLIEKDPASVEMARHNIAANGLADRAEVVACDLFSKESRQPMAGQASLVVTNPPFYEAGEVRASPDAGRRAAHVMEASLTDWLRACLDLLDAKGTLIVVHAPKALPEMIAALTNRTGAMTFLAVYPRAGQPAHRVVIRAMKGSRAPLSIACPLILHDGAAFTAEAERLHRGEATLVW